MRGRFVFTLVAGIALIGTVAVASPSDSLRVPGTVVAGEAFSIPTDGNGKATFYIVGPAQVLRREVNLGEAISIAVGELHNAGHYSAILTGGSSTQTAEFDVEPAPEVATVSFLAKPSRLPVNLPDGISGVAYVFDAFGNLILQPKMVSFDLSEAGGAPKTQTVKTQNGVAWVKLNSASKSGTAEFQARVDSVTAKRVVQQVSGDPCNLRMSARKSGERIELETQPLLDCSGNAVPDGTIVTFKEAYNGDETTVDVPIKHGVARTSVPAQDGAVISVATGVVMGNEIRWRGNE